MPKGKNLTQQKEATQSLIDDHLEKVIQLKKQVKEIELQRDKLNVRAAVFGSHDLTEAEHVDLYQQKLTQNIRTLQDEMKRHLYRIEKLQKHRESIGSN